MDEVIEKDAEFEKELDASSSARGRLKRKLTEQNPEFAKVFEDQTPEQRAWGKLIGMLILAKSNEQVELAFDWIRDETNEGVEMTNTQKAVAFFHAIASLGVDGAHYRMLRRMYIKANTNE
jgi:transposase